MRVEPLSITLDGATPIPAAAVVGYLAAHPRRARVFLLDLAEALIDGLDALDGDSDLEPSLAGGDHDPFVVLDGEADYGHRAADDEPICGAPEVEFNYCGLPERRGHINQNRWADGGACDDAEPTLGANTGFSWYGQRYWGSDGYDRRPNREDCEQDIQGEPHDEEPDREPDEADNEPTLGAPENHHKQSSWAQGDGCGGEYEPSLGAPENVDQTRWAQGKGSVEGDHDDVVDYTTYGAKRTAARQLARAQAQALVDKGQKHVAPESDALVVLRPGVAMITGGRR